MIETINDLKNNKLKAGAATSAMTSEHLTKMRKAIGSMNARTVRGSEPLRIGLNDLRNTEKRGKWWLVGASWKGKEDQPGSHHDAASNVETGQTLDGTNEDDVDGRDANTDLLSLAKHARMNTSIRRAIFMTLMSASDYQDAHFKLLKLNLTRSQEREIPHVLLHCAGAEQAYNPYYTVIAKKFCGDRRLRSAFQSALWDLFRKMGEKSQDDENVFDGDDEEPVVMATMVNYAKLYGSLIASGAMRLNALKVTRGCQKHTLNAADFIAESRLRLPPTEHQSLSRNTLHHHSGTMLFGRRRRSQAAKGEWFRQPSRQHLYIVLRWLYEPRFGNRPTLLSTQSCWENRFGEESKRAGGG